MKLLAFSDLHGRYLSLAASLIETHAPDWVVLLGDILPDFDALSGRSARTAAQVAFWETYASCFEGGGAPLTFIRGNHEAEAFHVPPRHRRVPGPLVNRVLCLEGIPIPDGGFGFAREMDDQALEAELDRALDALLAPQVVLCHAPPFGCLDRGLGSPALRAWLDMTPGVPLVLCGHVHEARGACHLGDTLVVNVAEGVALLDDQEGAWQLRSLESLSALDARQKVLAED